jgi:predicted anti-sigma-YlaC factor YlaD
MIGDEMSCNAFLERLEDFLQERLTPDGRRTAEAHLAACAECRELVSLAAQADAQSAPPSDLVGEVMVLTSGRACGSARSRLCDRVDRVLGPEDDDLMRMHLVGCAECAGLAAALARLTVDLPSLAELEPGPRFLPAVLARTSRRTAPVASWTETLAAAWRRLAYRPRIALEGAYVGGLILLLLFGTTNAPLADVPGRAIALVRTVHGSLPTESVRQEVPRIRDVVRSRYAQTRSAIGETGRQVTGDLKRMSVAAWGHLKQDFGTVWSRIASPMTRNDTDRTADSDDQEKGER